MTERVCVTVCRCVLGVSYVIGNLSSLKVGRNATVHEGIYTRSGTVSTALKGVDSATQQSRSQGVYCVIQGFCRSGECVSVTSWFCQMVGSVCGGVCGRVVSKCVVYMAECGTKIYRLVGPVLTAYASRAEDSGFESRLRRDFSGVESYQ